MRKLLLMVGMLLLVMSALILGYECGKQHAIRDSEFWITEFSDPMEIHIHLDGERYVHYADIG